MDEQYEEMVRLEEQRRKELLEFMGHQAKCLVKCVEDKLNDILSDVYTSHAMFIDTDAWTNYRQFLQTQLKGGMYEEIQNTKEWHWAKDVRDMIFHEHKDELVTALNQDLLSQIKELKRQLDYAYKRF